MVSCTYWVTTTKPIAAKWTALNGSCENGSDRRDGPELALRAECCPGGTDAAHFFLPHPDLPRTWPHDHGPHSRTSGNLRSGDRAEAEDQAAERRPHVSHRPPFLAGVPGAGDDAWSCVFRPGHLGILRGDHPLRGARSGLCDALYSGHAVVPHDGEVAAAAAALDSRGDVAGLAGAPIPGGSGIAPANFLAPGREDPGKAHRSGNGDLSGSRAR